MAEEEFTITKNNVQNLKVSGYRTSPDLAS